MNAARASKIQVPRLISYCAPIVLGFLIVAEVVSGDLSYPLRQIIITLPIPLGVILGVLLYYRLGHETLQYDERGFTLSKGRNVERTSQWSEFAEVSLSTDSTGAINVRLYLEPDGEYVEIPASKMGVDPFTLRNSILNTIRRRQKG